MKDIEDKLAALLMDYGVLKNADADRLAKRIAGMFAAENAQLAAKCAEMRGALQKIIGQCELSESTARDRILSMAIKHEAKQVMKETK